MILGINDYVIFEDAGYSAKNTDRPNYQAMMQRIKNHEFSHLLVWKLDRISRNLLDFSEMYELLKSLGVVFISKNEQFDTSMAIGEAMLRIILVFAELERKMTSERVTAVMTSRAESGQWNGGRVPFGYKRINGEFLINEEEARIFNLMVHMYTTEHQSLLSISRYLNDNALTGSGNRKAWSPTTVRETLINPFYTGKIRYNATKHGIRSAEDDWTICPGKHVPLLTERKQEQIIKMLKANDHKNSVNRTIVSKTIHIFSGLLTCGICGSKMTSTPGRITPRGYSQSIYGCALRRKSATKCTNKYISNDTIGPFIIDFLVNLFALKDEFNPLMDDQEILIRLLSGNSFTNVTLVSVEPIRLMLKVNGSDNYKPEVIESDQESDYKRLLQQRAKLDKAMDNLKKLYFFEDSSLTEKYFVEERSHLITQMNEVDLKIIRAKQSNEKVTFTHNKEFISTASYYAIIQALRSKKEGTYNRLICKIDPLALRNFLHQIISEIVIIQSKVTSIAFNNGTKIEFKYLEDRL